MCVLFMYVTCNDKDLCVCVQQSICCLFFCFFVVKQTKPECGKLLRLNFMFKMQQCSSLKPFNPKTNTKINS